jgi:hypothetical protein
VGFLSTPIATVPSHIEIATRIVPVDFYWDTVVSGKRALHPPIELAGLRSFRFRASATSIGPLLKSLSTPKLTTLSLQISSHDGPVDLQGTKQWEKLQVLELGSDEQLSTDDFRRILWAFPLGSPLQSLKVTDQRLAGPGLGHLAKAWAAGKLPNLRTVDLHFRGACAGPQALFGPPMPLENLYLRYRPTAWDRGFALRIGDEPASLKYYHLWFLRDAFRAGLKNVLFEDYIPTDEAIDEIRKIKQEFPEASFSTPFFRPSPQTPTKRKPSRLTAESCSEPVKILKLPATFRHLSEPFGTIPQTPHQDSWPPIGSMNTVAQKRTPSLFSYGIAIKWKFTATP